VQKQYEQKKTINMKPTLMFFTLMLIVSTVLGQVTIHETITDKWPYLYSDFVPGTVFFDDNKTIEAYYNVDVYNQQFVYYSDDKVVKGVDRALGIDKLLISEQTYVFSNDYICRLVQQNGDYTLLERLRVDKSESDNTGGAYGTGTDTDASVYYTSVYSMNHHDGMAYDVVKLDKNKGKRFNVIRGLYLSDGTYTERATKKAFIKMFENTDVKALIKSNKLKLRNNSDVIQLFNECVK
jgi:hypothetical protein